MEHLVIFVHGIGLNGHRHGGYLQERVAQEHFPLRTRVYLTTSNVGFHSYQTLRNTLGGIQQGGDRLRSELTLLFQEKEITEQLKFVSVVGASMGGIYLRYILPQLREMTTATLWSFISLATPHLGISGCVHRYPKWALSFTHSGHDLLCDGAPEGISKLCGDEYISTLQEFTKRTAYAPIYNDGMVSFPTASLHLSYPNQYPSSISPITDSLEVLAAGQPCSIRHGEGDLFLCEEKIGSHALIHEEDNLYFSTETEQVQTCLREMQAKLVSMEWDVVHTCLDHRAIAVLDSRYPSTVRLVDHILPRLAVPQGGVQ